MCFHEKYSFQCWYHICLKLKNPTLLRHSVDWAPYFTVRIPLINAVGENRQFSLQIMLTSCHFNSAIVRYFPSTFANMNLRGINYQWLWPNCCIGKSFGDADGPKSFGDATGLMGLACGPAICIAWTINSPWLVKREVVIPGCQSIDDWLKVTHSWRRLTTENCKQMSIL